MPGNAWNAWEIEELKACLAKGMAASEMTIGSRTTAAIQRKAARMHLVGDGISRRPWTHADEETLVSLLNQGKSVLQIAKAAGVLPRFSKNAIQKKVGRLSLANSERSQRIKQAVRLNDDDLQRFRLFVWMRAERCTPEQIALLWNRDNDPKVSRRRVIYHLQALGAKRPWSEVMQMPFSKAKQRRRSARAIDSQSRRWTEYREEMARKLKHSALEMRRRRKQGAAVKECTCRGCNKRWPKVEPFFPRMEKRNSTGTHVYHARVCKLCRNEQRREKSLRHRESSTASEPAQAERRGTNPGMKCAS